MDGELSFYQLNNSSVLLRKWNWPNLAQLYIVHGHISHSDSFEHFHLFIYTIAHPTFSHLFIITRDYYSEIILQS